MPLASSVVVTGAIGAITGVIALLVSIASYRRSNAIKSLDLRLELKWGNVDLRSGLTALADLINTAERSRKAVATATGTYGSGRMTLFTDQVVMDRKVCDQLSADIPTSVNDFRDSSERDLEGLLVKVHALRVTVDRLTATYQASLAADDIDRQRISSQRRGPSCSRTTGTF